MPDRTITLTSDEYRHVNNALRLWGRELADAGTRAVELGTVNALIARLHDDA
jgi:hypothetical protein